MNASQVAAILEVAGKAGILIDPMSEESLARAMRELYDSESTRQTLKEQTTREARRFSWKKSAEEVLECNQEVMRRDRFFHDMTVLANKELIG